MRKILIFIGLILTLTLSAQKLPVGIIASQKGAVAAPPAGGEMLANGALTGGTSWSVTGGCTISGDAAVFATGQTGMLLQYPDDMATNLSANTAYTLTFGLSGTSGGGILLLISSTDNGDGAVTYVSYAEYTSGSKTINFTTPADIQGGGLRLYANNAGDSGGTIDNLSLQLQ